MNKKQIIVILGLSAYIAGGLTAVYLNLDSFIKVLRFYPKFLIPVILIYSIVLIVSIAIIYLLGNNGKN
jgi:hypothetical protein